MRMQFGVGGASKGESYDRWRGIAKIFVLQNAPLTRWRRHLALRVVWMGGLSSIHQPKTNPHPSEIQESLAEGSRFSLLPFA
jgi:hypothetical protein